MKMNNLFVLLTLAEMILLMYIFETHYTVCVHMCTLLYKCVVTKTCLLGPLLAAVIGVCIVFVTGTLHGLC